MPEEPTGSGRADRRLATPGELVRQRSSDISVDVNPVSTATRGPETGGRLARAVEKALTDNPRLVVEAAMALIATLIGLLLLPTLNVPPPPRSVLVDVTLTGPYLPTYLGVKTSARNRNVEIIVGMNAPRTSKAQWQVGVTYREPDALNHLRVRRGHFMGVTSVNPGFETLQIGGTIPAAARSFSEMKNGIAAAMDANYTLFPPADAAMVSFRVAGPLPFTVTSGAQLTTVLPVLQLDTWTVTTPASLAKASGTTAKPNVGELYYTAGSTYQSLTGGPAIETGHVWDWTSSDEAVLPGETATGVDNALVTQGQNQLFIAAVLFGLGASGAAGFAVDIIPVFQRWRRRRKAQRFARESSKTQG